MGAPDPPSREGWGWGPGPFRLRTGLVLPSIPALSQKGREEPVEAECGEPRRHSHLFQFLEPVAFSTAAVTVRPDPCRDPRAPQPHVVGLRSEVKQADSPILPSSML